MAQHMSCPPPPQGGSLSPHIILMVTCQAVAAAIAQRSQDKKDNGYILLFGRGCNGGSDGDLLLWVGAAAMVMTDGMIVN